MRPWDPGPFGNEPALDWVVDLATVDDWAVVRAKLVEALADDAWRDAWVGGEVIAAAELVAAGRGRPRRTLIPEAEAFLDRVDGWPDADDAAWAVRAVLCVRDGGSELADDQARHGDAWRAELDDLVARLSR